MLEAADDVLVGGLLEEGRLALQLLLVLHIRERHDLDRVLDGASVRRGAEDEPLPALAERLVERPVVRLVLLQGGSDFLLAHLGLEVLEVGREHRGVRGGAHERALLAAAPAAAASAAFPVLLDAVDVPPRKAEVILEVLRRDLVEVRLGDVLARQALRVLAHLLRVPLLVDLDVLRQQPHEELLAAVLQVRRRLGLRHRAALAGKPQLPRTWPNFFWQAASGSPRNARAQASPAEGRAPCPTS